MFTNNWFEITAKANFEKYVKTLDLGDSLEIGCYEGQASIWLMENSNTNLTVIDTFEGSKEHDSQFETTLYTRFMDNIKKYKDRIHIKVGTSQKELRETPIASQYDFIYVDGSHEAKDVLEDAVLAFPLLRKDGIMIFDDYTWGVGLDYYDRPSTGIDAFLNVYGNQLDILEKNSQVIIKKK